MSIKRTVAHNLRRCRKTRGFTQGSLAEASGLHRTHVSGIGQGRINASINNMEKIGRALDIGPLPLFVDGEPCQTAGEQKKTACCEWSFSWNGGEFVPPAPRPPYSSPMSKTSSMRAGTVPPPTASPPKRASRARTAAR